MKSNDDLEGPKNVIHARNNVWIGIFRSNPSSNISKGVIQTSTKSLIQPSFEQRRQYSSRENLKNDKVIFAKKKFITQFLGNL